MRKDKEKAIQLRSLGKSYSEIKAQISVPKSTLSNWLAPQGWSEKIKRTINQSHLKTSRVRVQWLNKTRGKLLKKVYQNAENEAEKELEFLKYHPLFIAALMLYWGEGDKTTKYNVTLANTDPKMIRLFVCFLTEICQINRRKIKLHLLLYPDLNETDCKDYWKKGSGLEEENFVKSTTIKGRHKTRRLQKGVCSATVSSTYFKTKLLIWLKLMPGTLLSEQYYKADIV